MEAALPGTSPPKAPSYPSPFSSALTPHLNLHPIGNHPANNHLSRNQPILKSIFSLLSTRSSILWAFIALETTPFSSLLSNPFFIHPLPHSPHHFSPHPLNAALFSPLFTLHLEEHAACTIPLFSSFAVLRFIVFTIKCKIVKQTCNKSTAATYSE
ncbi:hypothetical protein Q648_00917 [Bartonella quintana JK 12]|uniref:Uncharacterized protein n=1 Tax=Bartonella quintana JK 68 TaxID=1134503 RepID=A0ABR4SNV7_BARQI|nr:hypothetical protein Q651_00851 [Bartonella quintana BQ2-D70]ETS17310.1 hypothetical protein Q648_00917 [Bartonella quintana JK 12]ETS19400.1 hypothetical protein Q647_00060 [Bartonella quintana JK 7]KEC58303.1 hypothetical protein O93_01176 [Bartonella quintana JK 19]KEC61482.1 hypothetical protein O91_00828 [Bartonella quintana JK 31]KEC64123.1 hypothetical protein O7Y_00084 [Bartonella quintana JK 63]KEC64946.1 hypothetical protein O7U_01177 [Bartonella quintana JK 68]KEC65071.1 hypoth